jgi:hypothetical protein
MLVCDVAVPMNAVTPKTATAAAAIRSALRN